MPEVPFNLPFLNLNTNADVRFESFGGKQSGEIFLESHLVFVALNPADYKFSSCFGTVAFVLPNRFRSTILKILKAAE